MLKQRIALIVMAHPSLAAAGFGSGDEENATK